MKKQNPAKSGAPFDVYAEPAEITAPETETPEEEPARRQTFAEALQAIEEARAELPPEPVKAYDRADSL